MSPAPARRLGVMTKVTCQITVSLDGYVAGPDQDEQDPLGRGGERLHEWFMGPGERHPIDDEVAWGLLAGNGAYVMGRNMFGPVRGEWSGDWRGWWGEDPPYHTPVFVLTHHPRASVEMEGGTTFHFVTDGIEAAVARAREAAGPDRNVCIGGGASTVNQALRAGLLDEVYLHVAPILLGDGARLFENVGDVRFAPAETIGSPRVTHVRYDVVR
jgi:dihydrofolate reductase